MVQQGCLLSERPPFFKYGIQRQQPRNARGQQSEPDNPLESHHHPQPFFFRKGVVSKVNQAPERKIECVEKVDVPRGVETRCSHKSGTHMRPKNEGAAHHDEYCPRRNCCSECQRTGIGNEPRCGFAYGPPHSTSDPVAERTASCGKEQGLKNIEKRSTYREALDTRRQNDHSKSD